MTVQSLLAFVCGCLIGTAVCAVFLAGKYALASNGTATILLLLLTVVSIVSAILLLYYGDIIARRLEKM